MSQHKRSHDHAYECPSIQHLGQSKEQPGIAEDRKSDQNRSSRAPDFPFVHVALPDEPSAKADSRIPDDESCRCEGERHRGDRRRG
jgi:hypothetical protein